MRFLLILSVAAACLTACSPRFGFDEENALEVPLRPARVFDNRHASPHDSLIPDTLPPGVLVREDRKMPEPPENPRKSWERDLNSGP